MVVLAAMNFFSSWFVLTPELPRGSAHMEPVSRKLSPVLGHRLLALFKRYVYLLVGWQPPAWLLGDSRVFSSYVTQ